MSEWLKKVAEAVKQKVNDVGDTVNGIASAIDKENENTAVHNAIQSMSEDYGRSAGQIINDIQYDPRTQTEFQQRFSTEKLVADLQTSVNLWRGVMKVGGMETTELDEAQQEIEKLRQTKGRHLKE